MSRVKWKRTRDGIEFIEKKTLSERMRDITFMQMAMFFFGLQVAILIFAVAWSAVTGGNAPWGVGLLGYLNTFLGIGGIAVTTYGHFVVGAESKTDWKMGILLNFISIMVMITFFLMGLIIEA